MHRQRYLNKVTQTGAVSSRIQEMVTSLKSAASKRIQVWWALGFFLFNFVLFGFFGEGVRLSQNNYHNISVTNAVIS